MRKLSVLVIHNQYQQPSGEDLVVQQEMEMLRAAGHRVVPFLRSSSTIANYSRAQMASLAMSATWNAASYRKIRDVIAKEKPEIAHCHNLLPLVSPAAYRACRSAGIPVVQTLHNYRLLCPGGSLYFNGQVCQDCSKGLRHGIRRGCYRGSRLQTAAVAAMLGAHRMLGTWTRDVDAYVALSQFTRNCFVAAGWPAEKIHVKSNFLPAAPSSPRGTGKYALFVGRLSAEKGVMEMLRAWKGLPEIPLNIVGDGPLRDRVEFEVRNSSNSQIKLLGQLNANQVRAQMREARFLVFPSRWYEPFGMALLEAAACGVPAVAARVGGVPELVIDEQTGLLFNAQDWNALIASARWAWEHPTETAAMGAVARQRYQQNYTAEKNYQQLMKIYQAVLPA